METFIAVYICMSGPSCPNSPILSTKFWYSISECEKGARLIAQGMFVSSGGNRYSFECKRIEYEPPNLTKH